MVSLKTAEAEGFVAKPDPARRIVLVYGPDAGLVRERATALLAASVDDPNDPFALVQLNGDDLAGDPARLVDEATTIPLFGGRRAVWVKAGSRNIVAAVELLLSAPLQDCRVVIEAGELRRNAPLRALCERAKNAVCIACYADTERDLGRLIDEEMRRANLKIAPEARAMLTPLLGGDRAASRGELAKLTLYAMGRSEIGVDDILAVVADAGALALDAMLDAAFAGRPAEADTHYAKARGAGTAPGTILLALLRQAAALHLLRLAVNSGAPVPAAVDRSQFASNFRRRPLIEAALRAWTAGRLRRAMAVAADAVRDSRVQPALADSIAARALLAIARAAREKS